MLRGMSIHFYFQNHSLVDLLYIVVANLVSMAAPYIFEGSVHH